MKDKIVEFLEQIDKARTFNEICNALNEDNVELKKALNELISEGIIHETKKSKYILMKYCKSLRVGSVDVAKNGYAFLVGNHSEEEDIFISKDNLNGAIEGDRALVDLFERHGKIEGKVIKILNRNIKKVVGEIIYKNNVPHIILDNKKLDIDIILENHFANLVDGHKVLVELCEQLAPKQFRGVIVKIIGHKNDPDIDILSIAYEHDIELEFSEEVKKELLNIPESVLDKDKVVAIDISLGKAFHIAMN